MMIGPNNIECHSVNNGYCKLKGACAAQQDQSIFDVKTDIWLEVYSYPQTGLHDVV